MRKRRWRDRPKARRRGRIDARRPTRRVPIEMTPQSQPFRRSGIRPDKPQRGASRGGACNQAVIVTGAASGVGTFHDHRAAHHRARRHGGRSQWRGARGSRETRRQSARHGEPGHRRSWRSPTFVRAHHRLGVDQFRPHRRTGEQCRDRPGSIRSDQRKHPIRFWDTTPEQLEPLHHGQRRRADQHGTRGPAAHAGGEARPDRNGHNQPRHHGAGGLPALRLLRRRAGRRWRCWQPYLADTGVTSTSWYSGTTNTPLVGEASDPQKMLQPEIMAAPLLWLLSGQARAVNGRRFIAADWDTTATWLRRRKASAPIAWLSIARMPIQPG